MTEHFAGLDVSIAETAICVVDTAGAVQLECSALSAHPWGWSDHTALTFVTAIDNPARFRRSRNVAAYFGLTSQRWQSGSSIDVQGRISKAGDPDVRRALYEAASAMLTRFRGKTALKTWGHKIAKRCHRKGVVAVARKLAVVMHAMWRDGTEYADRPHADTGPRHPRRARKAAADATSTHDEHAFMIPATAG